MSKIVSSKKFNVIFLATVLIVGTFTLMSPSFINNAQAEPGYDKPQYPSYKPDYNYKSKDSSISIKKVNCNNVNLNVNDASVNVGRPPVGDFTTLDTTSSSETEEQEGITTANNFANGERNNNGFKKDKDGFVYVCINNNNNSGSEGGDGGDGGNGEDTCAVDIERCFRINLNDEQFTAVQTAFTTTGINLIVGTQPQVEVNSFIELCAFLRAQADLDRSTIDNIIGQFERQVPLAIGSEIVNPLVDCIAGVLNVPVEME